MGARRRKSNKGDPVPENDLISIAELADELGTYKQTIFKIVSRIGAQTVKRRDPDREGQLVALVNTSDATSIREAFALGRRSAETNPDMLDFTPEFGNFYLIQLEPEHDPGRFKVGFTTDLSGRLRHHRCSAPFAQYLKHWPCRRTWERAAIDCMTADAEKLHTEVFRGLSLDDVLMRAERFFAMMPSLSSRPSDDIEPECQVSG
jgi:hypothetical protein